MAESTRYALTRYFDGITNDEYSSPNGAGIYDCKNIDINSNSRKITIANHLRTTRNAVTWVPKLIFPNGSSGIVWVVTDAGSSQLINDAWTTVWTFTATGAANWIECVEQFPTTISATNYSYVFLTAGNKVYFGNSNLTAFNESTVTLTDYSGTDRCTYTDGGILYIWAGSYFLKMTPTWVVSTIFRIQADEYIVSINKVDTQLFIFANNSLNGNARIYRWDTSSTPTAPSGKIDVDDLTFKGVVTKANVMYGCGEDVYGNSVLFNTDGMNLPERSKTSGGTRGRLTDTIRQWNMIAFGGFVYIASAVWSSEFTMNNRVMRYGKFFPEYTDSLSNVYETDVQSFWANFIMCQDWQRIYLAYSQANATLWYIEKVSVWYNSTGTVEFTPFIWELEQERKNANKIYVWLKTPVNTSIALYVSIDDGAYTLLETITSTVTWETWLTRHKINYPVTFHKIQFKAVLTITSWNVSPEFYDLTMPYEIVQ